MSAVRAGHGAQETEPDCGGGVRPHHAGEGPGPLEVVQVKGRRPSTLAQRG